MPRLFEKSPLSHGPPVAPRGESPVMSEPQVINGAHQLDGPMLRDTDVGAQRGYSGRSSSLNEETERMASGIGHYIQGLTLIQGSVVEKRRAQLLRPLAVSLKFLGRHHSEVHVHLHRNLLRWPGRPRGVRLLLDSQDSVSSVINEDQPVGVVFATVGGDLVAVAVLKAEQFSVELREAATILAVDCRVEQHGVFGHRYLLREAVLTQHASRTATPASALLPAPSGEGAGVDDEAIADVGSQDPLVSLVDLICGDDLDFGADLVLGAEVEHLLGLGDAADHGAGI
jgi:hypothetical protein